MSCTVDKAAAGDTHLSCWKAWDQVPCLLLTYLPANVSGRQHIMVQVSPFLSPLWQTQTEVLAPVFSPAQAVAVI